MPGRVNRLVFETQIVVSANVFPRYAHLVAIDEDVVLEASRIVSMGTEGTTNASEPIASLESEKVVKLLAAEGADISLAEKDGWTSMKEKL
ncbi:hypothetical protein CEP52_005028 [Fusarium oligoseptatum]|uniref:Uncharacterized protein n=1 Tax=Fusarium oligoseptatum TaxID=2604345 RepID=A0A428U0N5_9HYPO|nr:hypothetical protein CEP52_005028 [Fusarium oligoseptatum]